MRLFSIRACGSCLLMGTALTMTASSAFAQTTTQVAASSNINASLLSDNGIWYQGTPSASQSWNYSGGGSGTSYGALGSAATSYVDPGPGSTIQLSSRSSSDAAATQAGQLRVGGQIVSVIAYSGNPADAPAMINLNIHVSGNISFGFGSSQQLQARVGITDFSGVTTPLADGSLPIAGVSTANASEYFTSVTPTETTTNEPNPTNASNFTFNPDTGDFSWDTVFHSSYNVGLNGYVMNIYASNETLSDHGASAAATFNVELTSITTSPVPEPSSMLGIAVSGLLATWRSTRRITGRTRRSSGHAREKLAGSAV